MLFADNSTANYEKIRAELLVAAKNHHGKTVAVYVTPDQKQVLDYFGEIFFDLFKH